jgi:electron transfer flavoprotein beta subunit
VKVVVCVKQVAILGDEVEFSPDERSVDEDYLEYALNEWDSYAMEEALRITESAGGGEVVAVTVGSADSDEALRRVLAMGADRGIRVNPAGGDLADPLTTARALAAAIGPENPDLVFAGVQSSDSVQAATGTMLAELLGLPRVAVVTKIDYDHDARRARVHRELEGGLLDIVDVDTPAVLTVQTGINEPRYATLRAIKQAKEKEIAVVDQPAAAQAPAYRIRRMFVPPKSDRAISLGNDSAEVAQRIVELVKGQLS